MLVYQPCNVSLVSVCNIEVQSLTSFQSMKERKQSSVEIVWDAMVTVLDSGLAKEK